MVKQRAAMRAPHSHDHNRSSRHSQRRTAAEADADIENDIAHVHSTSPLPRLGAFVAVAAGVLLLVGAVFMHSAGTQSPTVLQSAAATTEPPTARAKQPALPTAPAWFTLTLDDAVPVLARDAKCFTQGIEYHGPYLYESCGMFGESRVRKLDASTLALVKETPLATQFFGEGLSVLDDRIYQLTWQEGVCFVYDLNLTQIGNYSYRHEGWGITHYDSQLIVSDGSDTLRFYSQQFELLRSLRVTAYNPATKTFTPVQRLNELEMVDGRVWANEWMTRFIHVIDIDSGHVIAIIDADALVRAAQGDNGHRVLNGIALTNDESGKILVTGKYWSTGFLIDQPALPSSASAANG